MQAFLCHQSSQSTVVGTRVTTQLSYRMWFSSFECMNAFVNYAHTHTHTNLLLFFKESTETILLVDDFFCKTKERDSTSLSRDNFLYPSKESSFAFLLGTFARLVSLANPDFPFLACHPEIRIRRRQFVSVLITAHAADSRAFAAG